MPAIVTSIEQGRGCGYRKPSKSTGIGIYLMGGAHGDACGRLPFPLSVCPCCSSGIKPARGWTWIVPRQLFAFPPERACAPQRSNGRFIKTPCSTCPLGLGTPEGRHGLLWVGEAFYPSPHDFMTEARRMGISRKVSAVPKGFVLGETWVYLAHRHALVDIEGRTTQAGVFSIFKPHGIDIVIDPKAKEPPERALKLAEQFGERARIVKVVRDTDTQTTLFPDDDS